MTNSCASFCNDHSLVPSSREPRRITRVSLVCALWAVGLIVVAGGPITAGAQDPDPLAPDQIELIREQVAPAYRAGQSEIAAGLLREMLPRVAENQIDLVNHELIVEDLPLVQQLLAESWLNRIHSQEQSAVAIRLPLELDLTLRGLVEHVERTLQHVASHPISQDPLQPPESFEQYEQLFWDAHVMNNLLTNAERVAGFAGELATVSRRRGLRGRLSEDQLRTLDLDYESLATTALSKREELQERAIELRIYRLEDAYGALRDGESKRDALLAAFVVESDGHQIDSFLTTIRDKPNGANFRPALNDPGLDESLQTMVEEVRRDAPDAIRKGQLLFAGLHWWMRGRYGSGPDFYGLLKNQRALRDPSARFPLFMPIRRPRPTDPMLSQGYSIPTYDRRHHYTWAYMDRYIHLTSSESSSSYQTTEVVDFSKSSEPVFW